MSTGGRPLRQRLSAALLAGVLGALQAGGCCHDNDVCHTVPDWRAKACPNFPEPKAGETCPTLDAFNDACGDIGESARIDGNQCCYVLHTACM